MQRRLYGKLDQRQDEFACASQERRCGAASFAWLAEPKLTLRRQPA
jgi:hypothetical protein